jgi:hypothetical protein
MTAARSPWDFFEKIYCISLKERPDRRASAAAEFAQAGLGDRVEFVSVHRHPESSEQGIFESHMRCLEAGLSVGAQTIAVFEDDVIFRRYCPHALRGCIDYISGRPWDALFFGCLVKKSWRTETGSLVGVRYRSLAHAYALNRPFAEHLIAKRWAGKAFDALLRDEQGRYFSVYPCFAFQSGSATDNYKRARIDKFRQWCGGLHRIQKMNEFYHRHRPVILFAHVLVVLAIVYLAASAVGLHLP